MDEQETQRLVGEFACLGEYYRQPLSDQVCVFYAQDLCDLPYTSVVSALRRMRRDPKRRFVPMPAEIREAATPVGQGDEHAVDLAARIASAISKFGYPHAARAQAFIGPVGWDVVERLGGWQPLCQSLTTDKMQTFYAQTREMCRTALQQATHARDADTPGLMDTQLTALLG